MPHGSTKTSSTCQVPRAASEVNLTRNDVVAIGIASSEETFPVGCHAEKSPGR